MRIESTRNIPFKGGFSEKKKPEHKPAEKEREIGITSYYLPLNFAEQGSRPSVVSILTFLETAKPVSDEGLKGIVYRLDTEDGSYAIKVGRSKEDDFAHEAKVLKRVPSELTGQKFVDYFHNPKMDRDILVSTFAKGRKGVLSNKQEFDKLFESLNILDSRGVLHGDLNMGNWLFDGNEINLIDYGEGSLFSPSDRYDEMYPDFILKTNLINLEQNGIPDCITKWSEVGAKPMVAFKDYLQSKAEFYEAHKNIAKKTENQRAYEYEDNLSKVLSEPDLDIIKTEAQRMDVLYTFEASDTAVNYKKYPDSAIRNWNLTIEKAENYEKNTREILEKEDISSEKRKYFEFQNEIAKKLTETYKSWGLGTISWINGLEGKSKKDLSEHEETLLSNKGKEMELPPNLVNIVLG